MRPKRCVILANELKGKRRPPCACGLELPCKTVRCRQSDGSAQLRGIMLMQGIKVGKAEREIIDAVSTHYFCSTALGRKPRDFGYFKIREPKKGVFELLFKGGRKFVISFAD